MFGRNIDRLRTILTGVLGRLPDLEDCECSSWADGIELPYEVP